MLVSVLIFRHVPNNHICLLLKELLNILTVLLGYGIWIILDTNVDIVGYTDADWVGFFDDRKSTSSGCFYVGNNLIA